MQAQTVMPRDSVATPTPQELSVGEALTYATRLHQGGYLDAARTLYERILAAVPDHADALNFLAIAHHQSGRVQEALQLLRRSSVISPEAPGVWNNLGNVCLSQGLFDEAANAYAQSLSLNPRDADLLSNLGVLLRAQGQLQRAEKAYQDSLALKPDNADTLNNLGHLYNGQGRTEEAVQCYCKALIYTPEHAKSRRLLGMAYYTLGRMEDAARVYREWLELEPASEAAQHHLAACTGQAVPERASDAYVQKLFDGFAASFESKLAALTYRAPLWVQQVCQRRLPAPQQDWRVLDAGCGTGLLAPLLQPWARHLCGVDLSPGMVNVAREKNCYSELATAELTAFLQGNTQPWHLIASADTLCYFGALDTALKAAFHALRPNGWLVFTVEALEHQSFQTSAPGTPWSLLPHGRYAHSQTYLAQALKQAQYTQVLIEPADLRMENALPVRGWVVSAQKPSPEASASDADGSTSPVKP
jgi:predicted TPR repeat methyltransferase